MASRDKFSAPVIFDRWKSPGDRPLLSSPSGPMGVSFPNAEVCAALDKIWASGRLSMPQLYDYADQATAPEEDILPQLLTTALGEMPIRDTSSFSKEAEAVTSGTIEVSQTSSRPISARVFPGWQLRFFIREDTGGYFHTYPHLSGPFRSLHEAENAFARHLDELRSPKMCTDGLSRSEICVRNALYWPDGTRKNSSKSCPERDNIVLLVQSLLDKYNEDHPGDLAYELEDVVTYGEIYDRESRHNVFYHLNFTTKPRRADDSRSGGGNLFFAEVTCLERENDEYVLNSFCVLSSDDKGRCYDCEHNGSVDLKHPTDAHKYKRGHSRPYPRCRGIKLPREFLGEVCKYDDEEARLAAEESMIRHIYKCHDDEVSLAKLDGAKRADPADSSKRKDGQGKGLRKYAEPASVELDGASRNARADSKREDDQGKWLRKYAVPTRRSEEYVVPVKLDGASLDALADSKIVDDRGKGLRKYTIPARRSEEYVVPVKLDGASADAPADYERGREVFWGLEGLPAWHLEAALNFKYREEMSSRSSRSWWRRPCKEPRRPSKEYVVPVKLDGATPDAPAGSGPARLIPYLKPKT